MEVWRELRARGFTGGRSTVCDAFAQVRGTGLDGGRLHAVAVAARTLATSSTRRACAWVLGWQKRLLGDTVS